jgi:hypothetical protein
MLPLLPGDPSELIAIREGLVIPTLMVDAALALFVEMVKKFWPALPFVSKP